MNSIRKRTSASLQDPTVSSSSDKKSKVEAKAGSSAGKGQGGAQNPDQSVDSIRRFVKFAYGCFTLSFNIVDWVEISSDRLFAVLPQHTLSRILDNQQRQRMEAFCNNNNFPFCQVRVSSMRISNPIVLSDQIQISTTGSTEVSSFVQSCKLMMFNINQYAGFSLYVNNTGTIDLPIKTDNTLGVRNKLIVPLDLQAPSDYFINNINVRPAISFPNTLYNNYWGTNYAGYANDGFFYADRANSRYIPTQFGPIRTWDSANSRLNSSGYVNFTPILQTVPQIADFMLVDYPHEYLDSGETKEIPILGYNHQYQCNPKDFMRFFTRNIDVPGYTTTSEGTQALAIKTGVVPFTYPFEAAKPYDTSFTFLQQRGMNKQRPALHLPTHFLGMVPITTSSGAVMKIRANLKYEMKIDFHFSASEFFAAIGDQDPNLAPREQNLEHYQAPLLREMETNLERCNFFIR